MNSMTGFGAASAPLQHATLRIEMSGVNRKQLEAAICLPRMWSELETRIREYVTSHVSRGRISVQISLNASGEQTAHALTLNKEKLLAFTERLAEAQALTGQSIATTADSLIRLGILAEESSENVSAADAWESIQPALKEAMQAFIGMRADEGANLRLDLLQRTARLRELREQMMQQSAGVAEQHREALMKRLEERGIPVALDDERLVKEIALFADKCDVSEEMTRLSSHLQQFERLCDSEEPVGRTLDFLCQEIFRELNTTGSKANNAQLAQTVVTAKTELEKIREQVQNVE